MKAFISLCHKDKELLRGSHEHLASLRRQEKCSLSGQTAKSQPGGIIDDHIDEQMDQAWLYLLLISSAFIDSQNGFEKGVRSCARPAKGGQGDHRCEYHSDATGTFRSFGVQRVTERWKAGHQPSCTAQMRRLPTSPTVCTSSPPALRFNRKDEAQRSEMCIPGERRDAQVGLLTGDLRTRAAGLAPPVRGQRQPEDL